MKFKPQTNNITYLNSTKFSWTCKAWPGSRVSSTLVTYDFGSFVRPARFVFFSVHNPFGQWAQGWTGPLAGAMRP